MSNKWSIDDERYEIYADEFDSANGDRKARRTRKSKARHVPKKQTPEIIEEIADPLGLETRFETTYKPSKYEAGWLLDSLNSLVKRSALR